VEDIKTLMPRFDEALVKHMRPSSNEAVHRLAKVGWENKCCSSWDGFLPGFFVTLLGTDAALVENMSPTCIVD
jgi:hypothetical protein